MKAIVGMSTESMILCGLVGEVDSYLCLRTTMFMVYEIALHSS